MVSFIIQNILNLALEAMKDSGQEIRNGHITKEEGLSLIEKFDGEYPTKYEQEF